MYIARGIKSSGNYNTELYNILINLPNNILFHNEHQLREPLGIYSVSISRVFRAFENMLEELERSSRNFEKIDLAHKELLDSLMAYIDDGYLIMKCFYPKCKVNEEIIFADKWLKKIDKPLVEEYKRNIEPYRSKLALIVNKTKHNHARYCHVETTSIFGKTLGYYIEGVNKNGVIEPNKEIHQTYNGMFTAISYNKDIRDQMINLYFISHYTAETIKKILLKNYNIRFHEVTLSNDGDNRIIDILNRINSLKEIFFPDEYINGLPQITIKDQLVEFRKPAYKSYVSKLSQPTKFKIQVVMNGDGVTKSWSLPYFKGL
ncbi:hypothetical protein JOC70_000746 [Clostridium pascui]|uniref:hypothetical protein n=1 Tax=Clostridium pascui TaxID=46609 RepID=UPI00195BC13D|nr:hypothetical protein [Clostridium pascui]MBM7869277.1 hypothetical protein [Clostridium pascui]